MIYYVYRHIRLDTGIPFNVGKGKNRRSHDKGSRNPYWHNIVNKYGYKVEIIKYFEDAEKDALAFEIKMIKLYKSFGYCKANLNEGGTGLSGRKHSKGTKEKMRGPRPTHIPWNKGIKNPYTKEVSKTMANKGSKNGMYGKDHSEESKAKMSENRKEIEAWSKGKKCPQLTGKNNSNWKGYCITPFGIFGTAVEASKALNINKITIQYRCNADTIKFKDWKFDKEALNNGY